MQFTLKNPQLWDIEKMEINVNGLKNNMVVLHFQADGITQYSQPIEIHESPFRACVDPWYKMV